MALNDFKVWVKQNLFPLLIIFGTFFGLILGLIVKNIWPNLSPETLNYIELPGKLVIRAFTQLLVPIIIGSLSNSIIATKTGENQRLITLTFSLFLALSTYASILGTILVLLIRPGVGPQTQGDFNSTVRSLANSESAGSISISKDDTISDLLLNMIPNNIIAATFMQQYTAMVPIDEYNITLGYKKVVQDTFRANYLGMCIFALILGFTVLKLDDRVPSIKRALDEVMLITMEIINVLMKFMPIGMLSWMCVEAIKMKSPERILVQLVWYFGTVLLAFVLHLFIILPGIYFFVVHKNPFRFYLNILPAMMVAFGSSSSAFTLPVSIKSMEENCKLPEHITRFVLPLGMNVHMNGVAIYYPMTTVFIAQMKGVDIGFQQVIIICIFAILMSVALPAIPSGKGALINFIAFCAAIGIDNPLDILAYTMTIDWLMCRIRTTTNVTGDLFVASIVHKYCDKSVKNSDINTTL